MDVTVVEPQAHGIYTREFFEAVRDHLADDGILFSNYPEFSPTALSVFHDAYEMRDPVNGLTLNQRYYTLGTFFETGSFPYLNLTDPRTFLPGMPLAVYAGIRGTL